MSFSTQRTKREPLTLEQFAFLQLVDRSEADLGGAWVKLTENWVAHCKRLDIPRELYALYNRDIGGKPETYIQLTVAAMNVLKYAPRQMLS